MKIKKCMFSLFILLVYQGLFARENNSELINYEYKKNKYISFNVDSQSKVINQKGNDLRNLFDHQNSTVWCTKTLPSSYQGGSPSIVIDFDKQIFVSGISVLPCGNSMSPKYFRFFVEKKISLSNLWDFGNSYKIENRHVLQDISFVQDSDENSIFNLFPTKRIVIEILGPVEEKLPICMSEINIIADNKLDYRPTYSFADVKNYIYKKSDYMNASKTWKFLDIATADLRKRNNDYFVDLTYYALHGNKEAQSMFLKSDPFNEGDTGTMSDIYKPLMKELIQR
jgi:hypothetical protein